MNKKIKGIIEKITGLIKKEKPELSPSINRLIDKAYVSGARYQRNIDIAIIDKAIETCNGIECWSEAARRARNEIVSRAINA
jgi:hypothetical protein